MESVNVTVPNSLVKPAIVLSVAVKFPETITSEKPVLSAVKSVPVAMVVFPETTASSKATSPPVIPNAPVI